MALKGGRSYRVLPSNITEFLVSIMESCKTLDQLDVAYHFAVRPPGYLVGEEEVEFFYNIYESVQRRLRSNFKKRICEPDNS